MVDKDMRMRMGSVSILIGTESMSRMIRFADIFGFFRSSPEEIVEYGVGTRGAGTYCDQTDIEIKLLAGHRSRTTREVGMLDARVERFLPWLAGRQPALGNSRLYCWQ